MQQIADWLEKLGMSEYAERFAENRIDLSVLPDLTDQDLEKLGVVLGDRRKMLRAIGELSVSPPAPAQAVPLAPPAPQDTTAERRQLTVMFCDLVDYGLVGEARPRGPAGDHRCLSPLLRGAGRAQRGCNLLAPTSRLNKHRLQPAERETGPNRTEN